MSRLVFRGAFSSETDPAEKGESKTVPRRMEKLRRGLWTAGKEPYADPRLSPRACLTRQAGFTAVRPAANSNRSVAKRSCAAVDSLEVSARLCLARRVGAEFRRDADCAPADGNGDFRQCTVRKIGSVKRGFDPGEDRHAAAPPNPVSGMAQIPRSPVPRLTAPRRKRTGARPKAEVGRGVGASRGTNRPRHKDRRSPGDCSRRRQRQSHFFYYGGRAQ